MQGESSHREGLFLSFFYILGPKYNVVVPGFEIFYVKVHINNHLQFIFNPVQSLNTLLCKEIFFNICVQITRIII